MQKRGYKKRPPAVLKQAHQEVRRLFDEAKASFVAGNTKMATRRVKQARRTAMRVQLRIPEFWNHYCRTCDAYLVQGTNSTIRVKKGIRILRCQECGNVRRKVM
ncbi:hypothetical protein GOV07_03290 [Candidatus Woesearchaeota archaeon]|nr:hypothetical protein [Candidatus Woesearchaeota archaeon]